MPGRTETALYESGRATAPPGVQYTSITGATSEGYTHTVASTSTTNLTPPIQSPRYTPNYSNYVQQRPQASPRYAPNYSPCPSPSPNYQAAISKPNPSPSSIPSQSPQYTPSYTSSSHLYSPSFASSSNNFANFNNNTNFDLPSTSTNTTKTQQSYNDNNIFPSTEQLSSTLFNIPKTTKSNPAASPRYTPNYSNFSYFSNNQPKYPVNKTENEGAVKQKNEFEVPQKPQKQCKDESEFNYNLGDLHQFLSKHGSKIKNSSDAAQDLVTDSLLNFLQRKTYDKNVHDNFPFDQTDINQVVVSICNKNKTEENKKESIEDSKLMNDLLSKVIEKEDKRKKNLRKEILDDLNLEPEEKKIKRDAMSHYQDDKSHHKRTANYGDFNQWDFLNQPDLQSGNNNRRGHLPFHGSSQSHSMAWNPMGMGMPHQTNPYYSNPRGHVMPAHAHTEYRYNQWNNPNHKNVTNIQNAHSQNVVLPQNKLEKHHNPQKSINSTQEFGLPMNTPPEYSKMRTSPHDMVLRTPPPDVPTRTAHPEYPPSISPALKNPPSLRTPPPLPGHPKNIISNPLSDLQMLVTNQENDKPVQKDENYQQETVDLSAHSDAKHKETREDKIEKTSVNNSESDDVCEKPVELTAKNVDKSDNSAEKEISSSNNSESVVNQTENSEEEKQNDKNTNKPEEHKEELLKPEKPPTPKPEEKDIRKSEDDDEIARELALLDGSETKKPEKEPEPKKESEESALTKLRSRRKSSNEVPASSSNEEIPDNNNTPNKRKSEEPLEPENNKKAFMEVETELEKMFEGVEEGNTEENSDLPTVSSTSTDVKPSTSDNSKKTPRKKPPRNARSSRLSSGQSSSSENQSHKKKKKLGKDDVKKKAKKNLCDVMDSSRKGPVLHVEGSRDCPTSVIVVNYPKGDDEDEKDKSMAKKSAINSSRIKHHNELDYRGRSRNGLFSSTLSARYDAHTTDYTWICVFCKRGPHYNALGDLFGPYIITKDENNSICDFSGDEKDISDAQKRGGRNKKSIRSNNMVDHFQKMSKKLRRHHSGESCLTGMTVVSDDNVDELRYEVWVHEQCAVWSPNVCLIGSRIVGMQEAIWTSVKTMCSKCGEMGANLGCVHRNCPNRSHYDCAKQSGWSLEQETFISTCQIHKPRS